MRYCRQENLKSFGEVAQNRLRNSNVFVFGAGGLGCPVLLYLNSMGVGSITVVDNDLVELSNLNRQTLFGPDDIGYSKSMVACARLQRLNPDNNIKALQRHILDSDIAEWLTLADRADLFIDCTDNLEARYTINKVAQTLGIYCVSASVFENEGLIGSYSKGSCLECYFPRTTGLASAYDCGEAGVLGSHVGTLGCMQASEAVRILTQQTTELDSKILHVNFETYETEKLMLKKQQSCPVCYPQSRNEDTSTESGIEITSNEFLSITSLADSIGLIMLYPDSAQGTTESIGLKQGCVHHTTLTFLDELVLDQKTTWICICDVGYRSLIGARILRSKGLKAYSLKDGKKSLWRNTFERPNT